MTIRQIAVQTLICAIAAIAPANASAQGTPRHATDPTCRSVTPKTCALAHSLGRGINLGNMLEATQEGSLGFRAEARFIELSASDFETVRLPVRWSNHATPGADAIINESFARRVDQVVDSLLARGSRVILNVHHYSQINGAPPSPGEFAVPDDLVETRYLALWQQIAERYRDRSDRLLFELLNEPHGRLNGEPWNALAARALAVVRKSNPERAVIIGPTNYNSAQDLAKLRIPVDPNVIITFHNYDPMPFTHQGVSWFPLAAPKGTPCCTATQQQALHRTFDAVKAWSQRTGHPIHLGEFGVHRNATIEDRAAYASMVREAAETRGFSWTYWDLVAGFGVLDLDSKAWLAPMRAALLPKQRP